MKALGYKEHNKTVLEKLQGGDLVEFDRGAFSHWAVYAGEGKVIHMTGVEHDGLNANVNSGHLFSICGRRFPKAFVKVDDFWDVVRDSKVYKNNDKDRNMSPSQTKKIIQRAVNKIGEIRYNVLWSNCEHFVSYCRYGKPQSDQVISCFVIGNALHPNKDVDILGVIRYIITQLLCNWERQMHPNKDVDNLGVIRYIITQLLCNWERSASE